MSIGLAERLAEIFFEPIELIAWGGGDLYDYVGVFAGRELQQESARLAGQAQFKGRFIKVQKFVVFAFQFRHFHRHWGAVQLTEQVDQF